jgi:hypothetical protein
VTMAMATTGLTPVNDHPATAADVTPAAISQHPPLAGTTDHPGATDQVDIDDPRLLPKAADRIPHWNLRVPVGIFITY